MRCKLRIASGADAERAAYSAGTAHAATSAVAPFRQGWRRGALTKRRVMSDRLL